MKRHAPAAERNREPILSALRPRLPASGLVLEVASGTGQHALHLAHHLPHLTFQPTDVDPEALASIAAWRNESGLDNLLPPLELDVSEPQWPIDQADAIFCANMVHISPWVCAEGLFSGAGRCLERGRRLFTYGPYLVDGKPTTESNADFDASLRARDPSWGLRDLVDIEALAEAAGLRRTERLDMPANNFLLVFEKMDKEPSP